MKTQFKLMDITKFIMSFLVVAIHTNPFYEFSGTFFYNLWGTITSLAVPYFFVSFGFLLFINSDGTENDKKIKDSIIKYIKLYLLGSLAYLPLAIYHYYNAGIKFIYALVDYVRFFFFVGENYNSFILWYLLSTIYTLLFIWVLIRIKMPKHLILAMCFIIGFVGCVLTGFAKDPTMIENSAIISGIFSLLRKVFINGRLSQGFIYIPIGMVIAELYIKGKRIMKENIILCITIIVVGICTRSMINRGSLELIREIIKALAAATLFWLSLYNVEKIQNNSLCKRLRIDSQVIYFIHLYVWTILYSVIYHEKSYGIFVFFATSSLSLIISEVIQYCKMKKEK